jgi:hypothetical protein
MIQDAFQRRLNATTPTTGHQGYAPALPFQQNAFGALANDNSDNNSAATIATQMAALTYKSQIMANMAANLSQQMDQYIQTLAHQQEQLHQNQHQIIKQLAALSFKQSAAGQGIRRQGRGPPPQAPFAPIQFGGNNFGSRGGQRCRRGQGRRRGCGLPAFTAGRAPPLMTITAGRTPALPGMHPATGGGYYAPPPPENILALPYF